MALNVPHEQEINRQQPEFDVLESEKDKKWFIQNIRYFSTFYNLKSKHNHLRFGRQAGRNFIDQDEAHDKDNLSPVEAGIRNALYYLGKQENIDYHHVTQDFSGNTLQSVWIKGKKIKQLIDHLLGNFLNQLENKELTAMSLSKDVSSRKSQMLDDLSLKHDLQSLEIFQELADLGVQFNPAGTKAFENMEDIQRFIELDWKETSELNAIDIARDIEETNDSITLYIKSFIDFAAANYCAIHNFVENGIIKQQHIPFYNVIWHPVDDDPFNRKARFVGIIDKLTPQEIFIKYPTLSDEDKEEIKDIAANEDTFVKTASAHTARNLSFFTKDGEEMLVTVVTMHWVGQRDLRFKESKDKFGNVHFEKIKKPSKRGEFFTNDIHKGVLIGDKFLVNYGYMENVIRSKENKSDPELPVKILTGNTLMGDGVSIIGLLSQNQDRMDFYRFKIMELISRDTGKAYIINGDKLGEGVKAKELISDLKSMGIHVTPGTSGEDGDPTNAQSMIVTVDMTLDPNVIRYVELFREEERIMEEAVNIPKIALGQQQTFIGLGTQRGTIAQSTLGLAGIFRNFKKYNEINLQHALNLAKIVYTIEGNERAPLVIGDRGVRNLQITKDFRFEDILIFIKTKDILDEAGKQRLITIAQALAQNQQIDILDYLRIEMADTRTELFNELEVSLKNQKRQVALAQQQQAAQVQQAQEQQLVAEQQAEAVKQQGASSRVELSAKAKIAEEVIRSETKKDIARTKK